MTDLDRLLTEYFALYEAGGTVPDLQSFVERAAPAQRRELARRIDDRLSSAPRRTWDPAAFEASLGSPLMRDIAMSAGGGSGLWPAMLPRLRNAARLKRQEVVTRLARELGVPDRETKVHAYYHRMEQGRLDQDGVSDTVLEKLAGILGSSAQALRDAGRALGETASPDAPVAGSVFARTTLAEADFASAPAPAPAAAAPDDGGWDEVDELFAGRHP